MKTVIILGDGMSDHPVAALGGKTPLMVAQKPNIDQIAAKGRVGLFSTIPKGQPKGSAVANLSVLGYDPAETFHGRAVLEAASMGVDLAPEDVAFRCNLIGLHTDEGVEGDRIKNHSAGHIETEHAAEILNYLRENVIKDPSTGDLRPQYKDRGISFHLGVSYRHLLVFGGCWASPGVICAPPHDHVGELVSDLLPKPADPESSEARETAEILNYLQRDSRSVLARSPLNRELKESGKCGVDIIWPWSPGRRPLMKTMKERFGVRGAVISAVDLIKGLGIYAGMDVIEVEGATGLWDTNYEGKAQAALDALDSHDLVYVHVEATDEAGHSKDLDLKIKCIENLDGRVIGPLMEGIRRRSDDVTVAVLPDHPTPVELGIHTDDPVPVAILQPGTDPDGTDGYDEEKAKSGSLGMLSGDQFIRLALLRA